MVPVRLSTALRIIISSCAGMASRFLRVRSSDVPLAGKRNHLGKAPSRPVDPALDGSNCTAESLGRFLIR
jgi:hypothetical protein